MPCWRFQLPNNKLEKLDMQRRVKRSDSWMLFGIRFFTNTLMNQHGAEEQTIHPLLI